MSLIIAGERSGVGKTTVTLSLLATLRRWQKSVQSFKVGPDYIDPMFHTYVTGRSCRNLDPVLTSEEYVRVCFQKHTQTVDLAVVEGVMGLFDGATGADDWASTAHIARLLTLPVLLVVDCSRLSRSIAALVHGYQSFDPRVQLAGLVLNRVGSDRHLELLKTALVPLNLPILGVLRRHDLITIPDRHLGLVPTAELPALDQTIEQLAMLGESCFDWDKISPLLQSSVSPDSSLSSPPLPLSSSPIKIAVARDRAFSFYYADNLEMLEELGAELLFWSPLEDQALPAGTQGLYFGGGFPEVFAAQLSQNQSALEAVRSAITAGTPTYAECGGLMYLSEQVIDFAGQPWAMVGVLPTSTQMSKRLTLGYRRAVALQDSPILEAGAIVWGHEFHRSTLTNLPEMPLYQLRGYDAHSPEHKEGWQIQQVHASYVHLHWGSQPEIPRRFLQCCLEAAQ
ncbi:MAG: cobyrinate a,c-diamide synthase [Elainellaceae cyanobacterium]